MLPISNESEIDELNLKTNWLKNNTSNLTPDPFKIFTNLIINSCEDSTNSTNQGLNCSSFSILNLSRCQPSTAENYLDFFQMRNLKKIYHQLQSAFFMHMWDDVKGIGKKRKNMPSGFIKVAKEKCPKIFKNAKFFF